MQYVYVKDSEGFVFKKKESEVAADEKIISEKEYKKKSGLDALQILVSLDSPIIARAAAGLAAIAAIAAILASVAAKTFCPKFLFMEVKYSFRFGYCQGPRILLLLRGPEWGQSNFV